MFIEFEKVIVDPFLDCALQRTNMAVASTTKSVKLTSQCPNLSQPCCCILELSLASLLPQSFLLLCFSASGRFPSVPFLLLYL
ncbi:hypothetical protein [Candidatus Poriferisodalis sp.]|uniref:hypothetical protein n=1 Tax=Candidatus Poriferisodalis sp. TaxID=3101277 RepID=UPI003AF86DE9